MTTATLSALFEPTAFGAIEVPNRIVMAPMTRTRSGAAGVPTGLVAEYYAQRAGVGLIVSEGAYPSHGSQAYVGQPGIADAEQAAGWKLVADKVHDNGGRIVVQLMHGGRSAHPNINGGRRVVAPSAIAIQGQTFTERGQEAHAQPEALTEAELPGIVEEFVDSARRAIDAGLDGVEIHSANGYLLHQFLAPAANQRTDQYGGSPENRARFVVEVVTAVANAIGADRVGIRISPENMIQDTNETDRPDVLATYSALLTSLRPLGLAYVSILHGEPDGDLVRTLAEHFGGKTLISGGFREVPTTREDAATLIELPHVHAVVVGRALIGNPDLATRWREGAPENALRPELFYGVGPDGYTDYPTHNAN
ncbi:alkene reductase [Microbacterium sp. NPDC089189]|uniref:alkene reductase n=1 Tax=Microbacterium sp. NPDC089189 TaxID=3154972 RepID=UPI003438B56E